LQKYEKLIQLKENLATIVAFLPYLHASKPYLSFLSGGIKERKLVGEKRSKLGSIDTRCSFKREAIENNFSFRGNAMIFCSIRSSRLSDCHNIVPRAGLFGNTRILGIAILLLVFAVSMVGSQ